MDQKEREAIDRKNRARAMRLRGKGLDALIPGRNDPELWKDKVEEERRKVSITSRRG